MLVLGRRTGEKVKLVWRGETIEVVVVRSQTGKVRLGFDAPKDVAIYRPEVVPDDVEAIAGEQVAAKGEVDAGTEAGPNDSVGVVC